jgi:hypothetical protein
MTPMAAGFSPLVFPLPGCSSAGAGGQAGGWAWGRRSLESTVGAALVAALAALAAGTSTLVQGRRRVALFRLAA